MAGENQFGRQVGCVEVEALLAEALDGALHGSALAAFEAHQQSCAACRMLVEDAQAGMRWLKGLEEVEPPRNLMHNILAQTIGALPSEHLAPAPRGDGWQAKLKERLAPLFAPIATPRFAMSFGMAFFSITLLLGIAGFHFTDLRHLDLSSKGIRRTYYETEARIMRYYDNMRLVYQIESRVRDLRRAAMPENRPGSQQPQPKKEAPATNPHPNNPSKSDNRRHNGNNPNSSRDLGRAELAGYAKKNHGMPRSGLLFARKGQMRSLRGPAPAQSLLEPGTQTRVFSLRFRAIASTTPSCRQNRRTA